MMRFMSGISAGMMAAILSLSMAPEALGQNAPVFQQTLDVGIKDPLILDVTLSKGDVNFTYRHEGQIIIYVSPKNAADGNAVKDYLRPTCSLSKTEATSRSTMLPRLPPPARLRTFFTE